MGCVELIDDGRASLDWRSGRINHGRTGVGWMTPFFI
jgi:hypothetical protein